jgi:hypothetical protein
MLVWSASRINYVFIFGKDPATFRHISDNCPELDVRTRLDHREYFEVGYGYVSDTCKDADDHTL